MIRRFLATLTLAATVAGLQAFAQVPVAAPGMYGGWGGWGWGGGTVAGNNAMGMSSLVQAQGQKNLSDSQAAINLTQARSQQLDNNLKNTNTYFEMQRVNRENRNAQRIPGLNAEESWRWAQMGVPKRLSPSELDPVTGRIYWPMALQNPIYDTYRQQLDAMFRQRETTHGNIGFEAFTQIQNTTNALLAELQKRIKDIPAGDYIAMKSFVESLAQEARYPTV